MESHRAPKVVFLFECWALFVSPNSGGQNREPGKISRASRLEAEAGGADHPCARSSFL
jgi:hypothetical protein